MQKKLQDKFHTKLISYDQFMEYKLYDKNEGYFHKFSKNKFYCAKKLGIIQSLPVGLQLYF